jgi:hypothetical protein
MKFILIAIIGLVVLGVAARFTLKRNPDDSPKEVELETATPDNGKPNRPESQAQQERPPSASPVSASPPAPPSPEAARHGVAIPGDSGPGNPGPGHSTTGNSAAHRSPGGDSGTTFWNDDTIQGYQDRWGRVQSQFVDNPQNATAEAEALITDVINSLSATVNAQKNNLDAWHSDNGADTEELRMVVRRYGDFLDRVLGA